MEPGYKPLERASSAPLMTQQEEARAIETDRGQIEHGDVDSALLVSASEDDESFSRKNLRRQLREFYGKGPNDLGLDEEAAVQTVRLVRTQENGDVITQDMELLSIWERDGAASLVPVETKTEPDPVTPTAEGRESIPGHEGLGRRSVPQRAHVPLLWITRVILVIILIVIALLGSVHTYSPAGHAYGKTSPGGPPAGLEGNNSVPLAKGSPSHSRSTLPSGPTMSPTSPSSGPTLPPTGRTPHPGPQPGPQPQKNPAPPTPGPHPGPQPHKNPAPPTPGPHPALYFGFNGSTQGWGTSEGGYKLAEVSEASHPVYSGSGSLRVTSALIGNGSPLYPGNSVYTHTEATDYFSPHNLGGASGGATVTCYVYLPPKMAPRGSSPGYIRVFVKDTQYRNDFSDLVTIGPSTVGRWIKLSFVIGANPNNEDQGFDASQVSAIGVRVDLNNGSTLDYTGPFYIDACSL